MEIFPPATNNLDELAAFLDHVDSMELTGLEEVSELPETESPRDSELVPVSLRLLKEDVDLIKQLAQNEGMPYTTMIRWVLHRFAKSTRKS